MSGYRTKALREYGEFCSACGRLDSIEVHHRDQNFRNNDIANLQVLCRPCHIALHTTLPSANVKRQTTQSISLQPVEKMAARLLADRLDRGNTSQFIARLIRRAAKEEIGADWERVVAETPVEEGTAA